MERTTKIFLLDDTSKALKNQGFLERQLQSGHSFLSQPRYDHFDTAAYIFRNISPQKVPRKKERTDGENHKIFLPNDTIKTLQNQSFSANWPRSVHPFSSADPSTTWVDLQI